MRHSPIPAALGALACTALGGAGCRRLPWDEPAIRDRAANLLDGRPARTEGGVERPGVLNDRVVGWEGSWWRSDLSAVFEATSSSAIWDLGERRAVRAVFLQGDNNDRYEIALSDDGTTFRPLVTVPAAGQPGMRQRWLTGLSGEGRFVRLRPEAGDGVYAVAELGIFGDPVPPAAPAMLRRVGLSPAEILRSRSVLLALALAALALLARPSAPRWWNAALLVPAAGASVAWGLALGAAWPVDPAEVALVRGASAAVAAIALLREAVLGRRWAAHRRACVLVLAIASAAAVATFFNLGRPQFHNASTNRPSYVHYNDTRVYFLVAKYFRELGFNRLYFADVAAWLENHPGTTLDSLRHLTVRDLRTHEVRPVAELAGDLEPTKARFSPERWAEFKRDAAFFAETMGRRLYESTYHDHGGNATPVWMLQAYAIWGHARASDRVLLLTALVDPLLLLLLFLVAARTFGVRTSLMAALVFGANDLYMYQTNWWGSTLRHDWLVYLGLGLCALRGERFTAAGILLGLSAMIRAFPAVALAAVALPGLWRAAEEWWWRRRPPPWRKVLAANRGAVRVLLAAGVTAVVLFAVTSALMSWQAWADWFYKVRLLDGEPHANSISLRSLVGGWDSTQPRIIRQRLPLFLLLAALYGLGAALAARRKHLAEAATLGLCLVPVVFGPSNYYLHMLCFLAFVAREEPWRAAAGPPVDAAGTRVWLILCGMCLAQYFTTLVGSYEIHFYQSSAILFAALAGILLALLRRDVEAGDLPIHP